MATTKTKLKNIRDAVTVGDLETLKKLLKTPVKLNKYLEGQTIVHTAAKYGQNSALKMLIDSKKNIDINKINQTGDTALTIAVLYDHLEIVDTLLQAGVDINICNANKYTSLHLAVQKNSYKIVYSLLQSGADCNLKSKDGNFPLLTALMLKNMDIFNLILPKADVNQFNYQKWTVLHESAGSDDFVTMRKLIQLGADINAQTIRNITPLHVACITESEHGVLLLLYYKANVNITDKYGNTAYNIAVNKNCTKIIELFNKYRGRETARTSEPKHEINQKDLTESQILDVTDSQTDQISNLLDPWNDSNISGAQQKLMDALKSKFSSSQLSVNASKSTQALPSGSKFSSTHKTSTDTHKSTQPLLSKFSSTEQTTVKASKSTKALPSGSKLSSNQQTTVKASKSTKALPSGSNFSSIQQTSTDAFKSTQVLPSGSKISTKSVSQLGSKVPARSNEIFKQDEQVLGQKVTGSKVEGPVRTFTHRNAQNIEKTVVLPPKPIKCPILLNNSSKENKTKQSSSNKNKKEQSQSGSKNKRSKNKTGLSSNDDQINQSIVLSKISKNTVLSYKENSLNKLSSSTGHSGWKNIPSVNKSKFSSNDKVNQAIVWSNKNDSKTPNVIASSSIDNSNNDSCLASSKKFKNNSKKCFTSSKKCSFRKSSAKFTSLVFSSSDVSKNPNNTINVLNSNTFTLGTTNLRSVLRVGHSINTNNDIKILKSVKPKDSKKKSNRSKAVPSINEASCNETSLTILPNDLEKLNEVARNCSKNISIGNFCPFIDWQIDELFWSKKKKLKEQKLRNFEQILRQIEKENPNNSKNYATIKYFEGGFRKKLFWSYKIWPKSRKFQPFSKTSNKHKNYSKKNNSHINRSNISVSRQKLKSALPKNFRINKNSPKTIVSNPTSSKNLSSNSNTNNLDLIYLFLKESSNNTKNVNSISSTSKSSNVENLADKTVNCDKNNVDSSKDLGSKNSVGSKKKSKCSKVVMKPLPSDSESPILDNSGTTNSSNFFSSNMIQGSKFVPSSSSSKPYDNKNTIINDGEVPTCSKDFSSNTVLSDDEIDLEAMFRSKKKSKSKQSKIVKQILKEIEQNNEKSSQKTYGEYVNLSLEGSKNSKKGEIKSNVSKKGSLNSDGSKAKCSKKSSKTNSKIDVGSKPSKKSKNKDVTSKTESKLTSKVEPGTGKLDVKVKYPKKTTACEIDMSIETQLTAAVQKDDRTLVNQLINDQIDLNQPNAEGWTPIHIAICKNKKIFKRLLLENVDVNLKNNLGHFPLSAAVIRKRKSMVKLLIENGVNVNQANNYGETSLHTAVRTENVKIVELLCQNGADVNITNNQGNTALHNASKNGLYDSVLMLFNYKSDLNAQNFKGYTPLSEAAFNGHLNVVKLLISLRADINTNQQICLSRAMFGNHVEIVEYLLQNVEKVVPDLLHNARNCEVVNLLVSKGVDINQKNNNGLTPLHIASRKDQDKVVSLLVKLGADISAENKIGFTPLTQAAYDGNLTMIQHLVACGADINYQSSNGISALHMAAKFNETNIIELLLDLGADINAKTAYGKTALGRAARMHNRNLVEYLLSRGATICCDRRGVNARDCAVRHLNEKINVFE